MRVKTDRSFAVWVALLLLGVGSVYLPGLHNELLFDDQFLMTSEFRERYGGVSELRQRLLSYGSFIWVENLFGEGWWKQRLVNLGLHLGVVASLFALFRLLLARVEWPDELRLQERFEPSRAAALRVGIALFALNPVAVYAVAYLIQRSIVAATLFVALSMLWFCKGLLTGRFFWYVLSGIGYVVAMLCKEHALMAPLLAIPLYVFLRRPAWRTMALVAGICGALLGGGVLVLLHYYGDIVGVAFDELSQSYVEELKQIDPQIEGRLWPLSIFNQAALFVRYGFLWFVPNVLWMSIDLRPMFPVTFLSGVHLAGAIAYLAALVGAAWLVMKRSDPAGLAGLCLLFPAVLFATEFATVWVQDPFVLYRSYLWAIALPGIVAMMLIGMKPTTIYTVGLAVTLVFGSLALERVLSLRHVLSAWSDVVQKVDLDARANAVGRWRPFLNRGSYYLEHVSPELAYRDFARAIELGEPQGSAQFNIGVSLQVMEQPEQALAAFAAAESMGFDLPGLYYHRAEAHYALGSFGVAVEDYSRAIERTPDQPFRDHLRMRRAEAAVPGRQFDLAIRDFGVLLAERPNDYRLMLGLGMAYLGKQDGASALPIFEKLDAMEPSAAVHYGKGLALYLTGATRESLDELDKAIALDSSNPLYRQLREQIASQP